uniref:Uncharacterized protein n=1 Tax=Anguilla anguilla TaxID=7936 RepID=A0A0E9XJP7_ANGAN
MQGAGFNASIGFVPVLLCFCMSHQGLQRCTHKLPSLCLPKDPFTHHLKIHGIDSLVGLV